MALISVAELESFLNRFAQPPVVYVGLSGGIDSVVLLHCLSVLNANKPELKIRAIHVNHGLSDNAQQWQTFCQQFCKSLAIPLHCQQVQIKKTSRQSLEQLARDARYQAFKQIVSPADVLTTGQHLDDQAETFLLRLKRGSGPAGLAGMQAISCNQYGQTIWRPLLKIKRRRIIAYAKAHRLHWIEDESNQDLQFDRNFLRQQILPTIESRWPGFSECVARSADLCRMQNELAQDMAQMDAERCIKGRQLDLNQLVQLAEHRQFNLLRYWLLQFQPLMPSFQQMQQLLAMQTAKPDAQPELVVSGGQVRRYQDSLYFLSQRQLEFFARTKQQHAASEPFCLSDGQTAQLDFSENSGHIKLMVPLADMIIKYQLPSSLSCRPQGRKHSRTLKKLWQEYQIPVWQRSSIPYLFYQGQLVAALGHWICADYYQSVQGPGYCLVNS
ncbi:tRNA lysidine(34) synthetase TilS [Gayadomonas joobiniege]|uniref:tRNA lysidine(34) synthetase TilS n=1 Tax=Gayadomonas joobiniege TaxID=1234606 RepID=UPI00036F4B6F|nr:tRNA lysidine(34) synthetase TilS [Gayadomonas joobiniege]